MINFEKVKFFPFIFLTLFFIVFISLFQTLNGYFWIDDNALIYKLQHLDQNIGYWGKGIMGQGAYRHIVDQFVPFYPLFKANPMPYFAVGLILHFLATLLVYYFVKALSNKKSVAIFSAAIFATGIGGLESILGITNSWQTTRGIIMGLFTILLYNQYLKGRNILFYLSALLLFYLTLETVFIRAHGLFLVIFVFDLIYSFKKNIRLFLGLIIRQFPFLLVNYKMYFDQSQYAKELGIWSVLRQAFQEDKLYLLTIPLQDLGNLFVPNTVSILLDKFLRKYFHILLNPELSFGSLVTGLMISTLFIYVSFKYFKKERTLIKLFIFSFIFVVANFLGFYARENNHTLWTTHRYLSFSFVGVGIFLSTTFYLLTKNKKENIKLFGLLSLIVVLSSSFFSIKHQYLFNRDRNIPAKQFFTSFDQEIPNIPKGSIIYFTLENNPTVLRRYGSFFGGMFSEGANLSIHSENIDYMTDFLVVYDFNEIFNGLKNNTVPLDKIYSFYYSGTGLKNTSEETRKLLQEKPDIKVSPKDLSADTPYTSDLNKFRTATKIDIKENSYLGQNPNLSLNLKENISSLTPSILKFSLAINPIQINFPYKSNNETLGISTNEKIKIFKFLDSRSFFRKEIEATAASFWKDQEPKYVLDGRLDTQWRGHRGYWDEYVRGHIKEKEYLSLNLKKVQKVSQIRWITAQPPLVPIKYKILVSIDGNNWKLVKEVEKNISFQPDSLIVDEFKPVDAQFLKMEIEKTFGNDGPEIKEIEVINEGFENMNYLNIEKIASNPFFNIENFEEYQLANDYSLNNSNLRLFYRSNIDSNWDANKYLEVPVELDGVFHEYNLNLPALGTNWKSFILDLPKIPSEISIKDIKISYDY